MVFKMTIMSSKEQSFNLNSAEIFKGNIVKCISYIDLNGMKHTTGNFGYDRHGNITSNLVKNATLIGFDYASTKFYIDLDKYNTKKLKEMIKISRDGMIVVTIDNDMILLDIPIEVGTTYVDVASLQQCEVSKNIVNSCNLNQKVKRFRREIEKRKVG